jgi:hypothetical protein
MKKQGRAMHFYIDESGHTGLNLFDPEQPRLYYGCLSSQANLDEAALDRLTHMRGMVGAPRLHANELGNAGLGKIARELADLQRSYGLQFSIYSVSKPDHAVICFFDQVFDSGMNPAITWSGYWSPLRYLLLIKLAALFDEQLAQMAWEARIELNASRAEALLVQVCDALIPRVKLLPDQRSRTLIGDTLTWAREHPSELSYNVADRKSILQVAPNIVGFQLVMMGIARRIVDAGLPASRIVVDRQSQFNKAQKTLADFYASAAMKGVKFEAPPGMPQLDLASMPTVPIEVSGGNMSAGLEITDVYLWIFKRLMEGGGVSEQLAPLVHQVLPHVETDEVSLKGIIQRFERTMSAIPELEDMSEEQLRRGREFQQIEEQRRLGRLGRTADTDVTTT